MVDSDNTVWAVNWTEPTAPGIAKFDGHWSIYGVGDGPSSNSYQGLVQDRNGDYWFGSFQSEKGVDRFDGSTWQNFRMTDGLAGENVSDIVLDAEGNLWMSNFGDDGGVTKYDGSTFTAFQGDGSILPDLYYLRLAVDSAGKIWLAALDGFVVEFDGLNWQVYSGAEGLDSDFIQDVYVGADDTVWAVGEGLSSDRGGLFRFDGTFWERYTVEDGLISNTARAVFEASNGDIWVGTNEGVSRLVGGSQFINYQESDGLIENHVRDFVEDQDGCIWIATWGGISKFNPTLGVFDTLKEGVQIVPNPAQSVINIRGAVDVASIRIYSVLGEEVLRVDSDFERVDISSLASGHYWLLVNESTGAQGFQKLIVH